MIKRICSVSGQEFMIENEDLDFYAKIGVITEEERDGLKSEKIPENLLIGLPTLCPEERMRRRLAWRNHSGLHHNECMETRKKIVSMYSKESGHKIYDNAYWWTDNWDPISYGKDFDFSKPFFEQFHQLFLDVPKMALVQQGENQNSHYNNCASYNKNCYLLFAANHNEDSLYCQFILQSQDCLDCNTISKCELGYELLNCRSCFNSMFLEHCESCSDCVFCKHCISCKNCFGCVNLRNKEYYFMNEKCTKEQYQEKMKQIDFQKIHELHRNFGTFSQKFPQKFMMGIKNQNCSGDIVYFSKNSKMCFDSQYLEDCKYCENLEYVKDSYDVSFYGCKDSNELLYECEGCGHNAYSVHFSKLCWGGTNDMQYCYECFASKNCFGCVGLKKAQYCIFNKQYSQEEYENFKKKIIAHMKESGEWGQFFPASMSPFGYNETVAQEYFPLPDPNKSGLVLNELGLYKSPNLEFQYKWKEDTQESKYIGEVYKIPEKIEDVGDEILEKILICEESGRNYKIQKAELEFYRKMNLPIPKFHPNTRHEKRISRRNPRKLWTRKCGDCQCEIQTTFSPERPEKVLCEKCYLKVVQ